MDLPRIQKKILNSDKKSSESFFLYPLILPLLTQYSDLLIHQTDVNILPPAERDLVRMVIIPVQSRQV